MPERIQRKRAKGWRMPPGGLYVGRPTVWGNPFIPGRELRFPFGEVFGPVVRDRRHAVLIFATYARITVGYDLMVRGGLAGRDLACWCPPAEPCHADVLLGIAAGRPAIEVERAIRERLGAAVPRRTA